MSTHAYSQEEVYGFTQYINNNLKANEKIKRFLPINPNTEQLFQIISESDGELLAELVLFAAGDRKVAAERELQGFNKAAPPKRLNVFQINDNFNRVINAAMAIGIKIVNIGATDLKTGKPYLVLGLLWQVIKMGLNNKLAHSQAGKFESASQNEFDQLIQQWVGEQTGSQISNLTSDFADGTVLLNLMAKLAKDNLINVGFELDKELQKSTEERIERALQVAEQLGIERFLRVDDVKAGNPKLIFTLLAETFSTAISREVGVGVDTAAERQRLAIGGQIKDTAHFSFLKNCNFHEHMTFDEIRAGGVLDVVEVVICAEEYMKEMIVRDKLQTVSTGQLDDNTYQLMNPGVPDHEIMNLLVKAVENIRDVMDELQTRQLGPQDHKDLFVLFKALMALSSDQVQRIQMMKTDFSFLVEKLVKQNLPISCTLPLLFYLHEMSLAHGNGKFDELGRRFVPNFLLQMNGLKSAEERCAFQYICYQIGAIQAQHLKSTAVQLAEEPFRQTSDLIARTAVSLGFVTLAEAPIDFQQAEHVLRLSSQYVAQMKNEEEQSLVELEQAELISSFAKRFPTQTLKYLLDNKIGQKCIQDLLNPPDLDFAPNQRHVLAQSVIAKTIRNAIPAAQKMGDELSRKQASEAEALLNMNQSPDLVDKIYSQMIANNLGNEILRSAARNATEALAVGHDAVVDKIQQTFEQVAKSSSITAFLESLKDIVACKPQIVAKPERFVAVADIILACLQKYDDNILVVERVLQTMTHFGDQPLLVHAGVYEQLDAFSEELLNERPVMIAYLELCHALLKTKLDILDVALNSLQRCMRLYPRDEYIVTSWFKTVAGFAGVIQGYKFTERCGFFDHAKEILGDFASNKEIVEGVFQALEKMIGGSAACCQAAYSHDIFLAMRQYAKFWQKEPIIVDYAVKAHMWALWFLEGFKFIQGDHDILNELEEMM